MSRIRLLRTPLRLPFVATLLCVGAASCRPAVDPGPAGPAIRLVISTQPAGALVAAAIGTPPVIEVLDRDDTPIDAPNLTVRATIEIGNAQVVAGAEADVVNGVATFSDLTLVGAANASVRLQFTLFDAGVGSAAQVSAENFTLLAGAPAVVSASTSASFAGTFDAVANPAPAILVRDAAQNPLAGIQVTFEVTAGEGRVSGSAQSTTDASGIATVTGWVLGLPGTNQLVATVTPTLQITFTAAVTTAAGVLRLRLSGHPAATPTPVRVTKTSASGPTYTAIHNVLDSLTVTNLPFGTYSTTGDSVKVGPRIWMSAGSVGGLPVAANAAPSVTVEYREHGRLEVTTLGLPAPALPATIDFQPTGGASALLFEFGVANQEITRGLGPIGNYNAVPRTVSANGQTYAATQPQQAVVIAGGATVTSMTVTYAVVTGTLTVVRAGTLPVAAAPMVDITGPGGFHETVFLSATRSWTGLAPGTYTVVSSPITVAAVTYAPTPATTPAVVTAGNDTQVTVTWAQ